jgi:hypothetical protein
MRLEVSGINPSTTQYRFLWGFYVRGFKPWEHCQPCFRGTRAPGITPSMGDGFVQLDRPTKYFYLHGFAPGPQAQRGERNLHLAVRPKLGSTATVRSFYGPLFTIHDAEQIDIQEPIAGFPRSEDIWTRCKNFRFGAQVFDARQLGPDTPRIPIVALRASLQETDIDVR